MPDLDAKTLVFGAAGIAALAAVSWTAATGKLPFAAATCADVAPSEFASSVANLNRAMQTAASNPTDANLLALGAGGMLAFPMMSVAAGIEASPLRLDAVLAGEQAGQQVCRANANVRVSYSRRIGSGSGPEAFRKRTIEADLTYAFSFVPSNRDAVIETMLPQALLERIAFDDGSAQPLPAHSSTSNASVQSALGSNWFGFLMLAVMGVIPSAASAWVARRKRRSVVLWAALGWLLSYLGLAAIIFTEESEPQLPHRLRVIHAKAKATGRIEALPSSLRLLDLRKWQEMTALHPLLAKTFDKLGSDRGTYFAELLAVAVMTFVGKREPQEIANWVAAEADQIVQRQTERANLTNAGPDHASLAQIAGDKVRQIYATANGIALELKDRTAVVEINGKFTRFLSLPTYKDTYNDFDIWSPVNDTGDRQFAMMRAAKSGAMEQRAMNRNGLLV